MGGPPSDADRAAGRFEIAFACVFCGAGVDEDAQDFCELTVAASAGVATFTCHAACLRNAAADPEIFPDLVTPRELPPDIERPSEALIAAWTELSDVLAQINDTELESPEEVRALTRAVEDAATTHGVVIDHSDEQ